MARKFRTEIFDLPLQGICWHMLDKNYKYRSHWEGHHQLLPATAAVETPAALGIGLFHLNVTLCMFSWWR
jgi:hypothetical protein